MGEAGDGASAQGQVERQVIRRVEFPRARRAVPQSWWCFAALGATRWRASSRGRASDPIG
jgi:hypothetical protein